MDKVSHKRTSNHCFHWWYFHRVSLWGFPRGEQSILAGRACLSLSSSHAAAPKTALLQGSKEGKKSRDPTDDGGLFCPFFCGHRGNTGALEWQAGVKTQSLSPSARHSVFTATTQPHFVQFESCLAPFSTEGAEDLPTIPGNLPPSENTSWKILCHTEKNCLVTPPPAKNALYKNRFWNRKVNNYSFKKHLQAAYKYMMATLLSLARSCDILEMKRSDKEFIHFSCLENNFP